jgi:hypothetical protein
VPEPQTLRALLDPPPALLAAVLTVLLILPPALRRSWRRVEYPLLLGGIALALLLGEASCRLLGLGAPAVGPVWIAKRATTSEFELLMEPESQLEFRYPSDPRGYFGKGNRVVSRINSQGFRGHEASLERPAGTLRIAVLGDSFTLGTGVRDEDTLPAQLERELAADGTEVEILNFGIGGTNTAWQVRLLERQVLGYRPDLVLMVVFLNDAGRRGTISFLSKPWALASLRRRSHFLNALLRVPERRLLHRAMIRHYRQGFQAGSPGWLAVQRELETAKGLCETHGCELMVAVYPVLFGLDGEYPFRQAHASIEGFCERAAIPFADLLPALEGQEPSRLWVHQVDQHPNEIAHSLAATRLAAELRAQGLLSSRRPAGQ